MLPRLKRILNSYFLILDGAKDEAKKVAAEAQKMADEVQKAADEAQKAKFK